MRKPTTAERRERQLEKLVLLHTDNPTETDIAKARKLMNSYYRLCGLSETNLYLSNNERTCNTTYCAISEAKEHKWYERLDKEFHDYCGLNLHYLGYFPSIVRKDSDGRLQDAEVIETIFYE